MTRGFLFFVALILIVPLQTLAAEADFPIPANIRPAIDFWFRVYTEVDTNSGFLHDSENLAIVYTALERDRDLINNRRRAIAEDLRVLAGGKRSGLTESQRQLLALWGANTSNARLARAADNIRWQLGQSDRFLAGMKRSGAYRRHIESVIRSKNMPIELAALPHVESSFHPGAYSSAAATGMWQFVRSTAQRFMQVDYVVDERLDPYAATYAAMELLEYNYNALGTWPLALTAYNHGANGMARAVRDVGTSDMGRIIADYRGPRFGFASRNFYPQFLAVLEVEKRAEEIFGPIQYDRHPEFVELELDSYVDANLLAGTFGVNLNDLRRDNPALQPSVWSGTKRIPRGYRIKLDRLAFPGDMNLAFNSIPLNQRYGEQIPDLSYVVSRGDSLSLIAERYRTSVSELVAINQLRDRNRIRIGQTLLLPQDEGNIPTLLAESSGPLSIPDDGRYEVQRGDTLSIISERFRVAEDRLLALNSLNNRDLIFPGQTLFLKSDESAAGETVEVLVETFNEIEAEQRRDEQTDINRAIAGDGEEEVVVLASLDVDSGNVALEVDEVIQAAEEREQLLTDLASDPSDYSVAGDHTIEIQAAETLGHYAEWLGILAWDLRRLNGMNFGEPVIIGQRLKLDFSEVNIQNFETRRREYHRDLQAQYFDSWHIKGTERYSIRNRDLLVNLARQRSVPLWLFQQYNPDVDSGRMQIGQEVVFPVVERAAL